MHLISKPRPPATSTEARAAPFSGGVAIATMRCVVVARSQSRRQVLARSATEAGWETTWCKTPQEAFRQTTLREVGLALVDVARSQQAYRAEAEGFLLKHQQAGGLAVVCNDSDLPAIEVWARSLGVWVYLSELASESEFAEVCRDARDALLKQSVSALRPTPSEA